ncbi:hypothetical protein LRE75_36045 [Streptomyces sp. 372A]
MTVRDRWMGTPAAQGNMCPLSGRCGPPQHGDFVDAELPHGLVAEQLVAA